MTRLRSHELAGPWFPAWSFRAELEQVLEETWRLPKLRASTNFCLRAVHLSFSNLNLHGTSWQTESQKDATYPEVFTNFCAATSRKAHSQQLSRWEDSEAGANRKVHGAKAVLEMSPEDEGGQNG